MNSIRQPGAGKRNSRSSVLVEIARKLHAPEAHRLQRRVAREFDALWQRPRAPGPIDVIDIFSGCGGMSAGFVGVNALFPLYRLAAAVDIDRTANETYASNLGVVPIAMDVSEIASRRSRLAVLERHRRPGHPLVLIGCAPCQGFSSHRNSEGQRDDRNSLFLDFARIAAALRPDAVVVENVPELLTDRYWSWVQAARKVLGSVGYRVYVGIHNMAEYGVPQERFRALILAMTTPFEPPRAFLGVREFRTVRDAIGGLPALAAGERSESDPLHFTASHRESTVRVISVVPKNGGSRPPDVGPRCLVRAAARQGKPAYEDVYGRLAWDRPSITITHYARNPASGRFCHPEQDRGLSVREAALLQGFPIGYRFAGSLDACFRQIGNAVPPPFAAFLAFHVAMQLLADGTQRTFDSGIDEPVGSSFSRIIPSLKAKTRSLTLRH